MRLAIWIVVGALIACLPAMWVGAANNADTGGLLLLGMAFGSIGSTIGGLIAAFSAGP